MANCKSCGASIHWGLTHKGNKVPLDSNHKNVYVLLGQNDLGEDVFELRKGYESHFATCPNASQHRKMPGPKTE